MAKKPHLSRRYMGWKTKTTAGDLCKYRVYEIMGTGRKNEQRTFVVQSLILTDEPSGYLSNHTSRILRVFKGKALLLNEDLQDAIEDAFKEGAEWMVEHGETEVELEKEIERIVKDEERFMKFQVKEQLIKYVARHFAEWGATHLNNKEKAK